MSDQVRVLTLARLSETVAPGLIGYPVEQKLELWESIGSTNERAIELAGSSLNQLDGTVIVARHQSSGRGRHGRQWTSPSDSGIYVSFILQPQLKSLQDFSLITLAVGVATAQAIENVVGLRIGLKWVNDLVFDGKKLGGILAEIKNFNGINTLIIGIGLNLSYMKEDVPLELQNKMTWIEQISGQPADPNLLLAELCTQLERSYSQLLQRQSADILQAWKQKSVTLGRDVRATVGDRIYEGRAIDVAGNGALIVQTEHERVELHAGEVSIRNLDGSYC